MDDLLYDDVYVSKCLLGENGARLTASTPHRDSIGRKDCVGVVHI